MKLPHLIIIFILIIMPIVIVSSAYIDTQIDIMKTEEIYDSRLLNSTYDAVKAFQINTANTMYYTAENRVKNMEATANTFFYSLATSFKYTGTKADTMKEYVPAILLTMYDGYYIYEPFTNTIPNVDTEVESEYEADKTIRGLKAYVSYTCKYKHNGATYMITYSLDNYVVIDEFEGGDHKVYKGYLIDGIERSGTDESNYTYTYKGVNFTKSDTEVLSEFLGEEYGNKLYYYMVEDGTKYYYLDKDNDGNLSNNDQIVYINDSGTFSPQVNNYEHNKELFEHYYNKIFANDSAYLYYKEAYEFKEKLEECGVTKLKIGDIDKTSPTYSDYDFTGKDETLIFDFNNIEDPDSNFNRHRAEVIRAVITTNLKTAISGFNKYTSSTEQFIMPKISESDWELLENNVCMATFFQGLRIKNKLYNSYAVVANSLNKEYPSENDIYILKSDTTFTRANDNSLLTGGIAAKNTLKYYPGVLRINIEPRTDPSGKYYNPISRSKSEPYLESYTTFAGKLHPLDTESMSQYIGNLSNDGAPGALKKAYFMALAREKYCSYKSYDVNILSH